MESAVGQPEVVRRGAAARVADAARSQKAARPIAEIPAHDPLRSFFKRRIAGGPRECPGHGGGARHPEGRTRNAVGRQGIEQSCTAGRVHRA